MSCLVTKVPAPELSITQILPRDRESRKSDKIPTAVYALDIRPLGLWKSAIPVRSE